ERPHLHFAEALAAELRLAAQRLLGDEAVGADRPRVDLVVHEVMQLQHVDVADGDAAIEKFAGAAVDQANLTRAIEPGLAEHLDDVVLARAVEDRRRDGNAGTQILGELEDLLVAQLLDVGLIDLVGVDTAQEFAQIARLLVGTHRLVEQIADLPAEARRGPTEMGLEDLTDIHAARHAERIEHDVDMRAVLEIRHVLDRHDARDDALVAVTAGHLVAGLKLALHRDEHL